MQSTGISSIARIIRGEIFNRVKRTGHVMFRKYLLITNAGISVSLSGFGDILQQHYEVLQGERKTWDVNRSKNMAISGLPIGIICHMWYNILDRHLPGRTIRRVVQKVVVDQLCFSPICIVVFFVTLGGLENAKPATVKAEIIQKGWLLYAAEWMIWPPAQVINFYFLPTRYRVLYDNTISLGYDVYTSYVKHGIPLEEDKIKELGS